MRLRNARHSPTVFCTGTAELQRNARHSPTVFCTRGGPSSLVKEDPWGDGDGEEQRQLSSIKVGLRHVSANLVRYSPLRGVVQYSRLGCVEQRGECGVVADEEQAEGREGQIPFVYAAARSSFVVTASLLPKPLSCPTRPPVLSKGLCCYQIRVNSATAYGLWRYYSPPYRPMPLLCDVRECRRRSVLSAMFGTERVACTRDGIGGGRERRRQEQYIHRLGESRPTYHSTLPLHHPPTLLPTWEALYPCAHPPRPYATPVILVRLTWPLCHVPPAPFHVPPFPNATSLPASPAKPMDGSPALGAMPSAAHVSAAGGFEPFPATASGGEWQAFGEDDGFGADANNLGGEFGKVDSGFGAGL
eukprot:411949-Rhodomonas_salina.1